MKIKKNTSMLKSEIIFCLLVVIFGFLSIYCLAKERKNLGILNLVLAIFAGVFFISLPSKEYIGSTIDYYNSLKDQIEVLQELDPECKEVVINTFSPKLYSEVDRINGLIEFNKSRVGAWNEFMISKDIANLEKIRY